MIQNSVSVFVMGTIKDKTMSQITVEVIDPQQVKTVDKIIFPDISSNPVDIRSAVNDFHLVLVAGSIRQSDVVSSIALGKTAEKKMYEYVIHPYSLAESNLLPSFNLTPLLETAGITLEQIIDVALDTKSRLYILAFPYTFIRVDMITLEVENIDMLGVNPEKNFDAYNMPKTRVEKGRIRVTE
jgi:hypothetical protein